MLPPNIAHLAAKAKAADSIGLRYADVTVTALEGAVTEATMLVDTVAGLEAKLLASYEAWDKLYAIAARVDFDASESAVPEDQDTWIEFIRGIQDALEPLVHPMEAGLAAAKVEASLNTLTTAVNISAERPTSDFTAWPHTEFLIWNHERGMWWKNARRGYSRDIADAGMYPREQAAAIVEDGCHAWAFYNKPGPPPEVMIPYTDDVQHAADEVRKARRAAIAAREAAAKVEA